ncbi:hypothetical protein F2P56_005561 [Juglans regia]|uniref:Two-pore potassium channel 1-like n=2 Tax=Juglans regia TaxID=51240 RepID=A0A2I4HE59_JUGRE|nr:two-pore potassium channel 1-like [Juglans regia]XP_035543144.1 two-pore potassium channel 1-like [Juglans regia]XP_035543145.1 two-pore potassium channel 1-like [Juglans regia]KAF5479056.1 hypothetical protein F2P56_005561 [Juglans regia]
MASNGAQEPTLSGGLEDPATQKNETNALKRRIYGYFKGARVGDSVPPEENGTAPTPARFNFPSVKLHPSLKQVGMVVGIYLSVGSLIFYIFRHQFKGKSTNALIDCIYVSVSTMTTIGYGDLVPDSVITKLFASLLAVSGMGLAGIVLNITSEYLLDKQEKMLMKALHVHKKLGPEEMEKEFEAKRVKYSNFLMIGVVILVHVLVGITHLAAVEGFDFIDAFYWVFVTITTLGYEDESFKHTKGRFFAIVWVLTSTTSLAQMFLQVIEVKFEGRHKALVNLVLDQRRKHLDLEAADLNNEGVVNASEFVIHKLKEMGKISQEDIALVMKEFEDQREQSGSLSASNTKPSTEPSQTEKKY